jgi:hypothetical protein
MDCDRSLWDKIKVFSFDDPSSARPFSTRLASENGWSAAYTDRVVDEYRRFLYLTQVAGREVTPSADVDEAWHLHLLYTRSYWNDLCGRVLARPLHHGPTRGGAEEGARYRGSYAATLQAYRDAFGDAPPSDIWPDVEARFKPRSRLRIVDPSQVWIVPKRPLAGLLSRRVQAGGIALAATASAGTALAAAASSDGAEIWPWLVFGLVAVLILFRSHRGNRDGQSGGGCSSSCGGESGCGSGCGGGCS